MRLDFGGHLALEGEWISTAQYLAYFSLLGHNSLGPDFVISHLGVGGTSCSKPIFGLEWLRVMMANVAPVAPRDSALETLPLK